MGENQPLSTSSGEGRRFSPDFAIALLVLSGGSNFSVVKSALNEFSPLAFNSTPHADRSTAYATPEPSQVGTVRAC